MPIPSTSSLSTRRTAGCDPLTAARGYADNKKDLLDRLRRIEGQVRGIHRMVEEDQYCIDILTQITSVTAAVRAVGLGLLDDHVHHCIASSVETGDASAKSDELMAAVARFVGR